MGKKVQEIGIFDYVNNYARTVNESKIFAGLMIVIINIASKYVSFKFSKTMESYLKYTFSRDILVFAFTWMGTRDIFVAFGLTLLFIFIADFLMNEESSFCCLPETFITQHMAMLDTTNSEPTPEEIVKAKTILEKTRILADANLNPAYQRDFTPNTLGY
jgi:hypothetical protein